MGHSIPAFSQLNEIEKLLWSDFKNEIRGKDRKKLFDTLFENSKLYASYLAIANRPISIEPRMIGLLFYYCKMLVSVDDYRNDEYLDNKIVTCEIYESNVKELFDKTSEIWQGLVNSPHQKEGEELLEMFFECCYDLDDEAAKMVMEKYSDSNKSLSFSFCLLLQNQKLIQKMDESKMNCIIQLEDVLLDYID
jgi:hypothetical protein